MGLLTNVVALARCIHSLSRQDLCHRGRSAHSTCRDRSSSLTSSKDRLWEASNNGSRGAVDSNRDTAVHTLNEFAVQTRSAAVPVNNEATSVISGGLAPEQAESKRVAAYELMTLDAWDRSGPGHVHAKQRNEAG